MSPFLLGVSLLSLDRVLGRTLVYTHGEASGFFCVWTTIIKRDFYSRFFYGEPWFIEWCAVLTQNMDKTF